MRFQTRQSNSLFLSEGRERLRDLGACFYERFPHISFAHSRPSTSICISNSCPGITESFGLSKLLKTLEANDRSLGGKKEPLDVKHLAAHGELG